MGDVVVGVDDSEAAGNALRYAIEEATRRGCKLKIVHAWRVPATVHAIPGIVIRDEAEEERCADVLEQAVRNLGVPRGLTVEKVIVKGWAADALIQATAPDDVLVVGCRTSKGRSRGLHGAVGEECIRQAPCPVIVVPLSQS